MDQNPIQGQQQEIARLVRENNKMLHAMRRNAFWSSIFKFVIYGAFLLAPLWFYMTYLSGAVDTMLNTMEELQGTGVKAQTQFGDFQNMLKQLQQKFPSLQ